MKVTISIISPIVEIIADTIISIVDNNPCKLYARIRIEQDKIISNKPIDNIK
jgi:hypothetical protein